MADNNWNGSDANWNTPGDWSKGLPGTTSNVVIASGVVTVTSPISVASILAESSLYFDDSMSSNVSGAVTNTDYLEVDGDSGEGGSSLTIGGALTNSDGIYLGNSTLSADDTISAASLTNTGNIYLTGDDTLGHAHSADLIISGAASLGSKAGQLNGSVNLSDDALVEFGSGQIATIASGGSLRMTGADVYIADKGSPTSNSALTGLSANAGTLWMDDGVQITTTGALSNSGTIYLDEYDTAAGSDLTIGGALTNSGSLSIGYFAGAIDDDDIVSAKSVNDTGGSITLNGNTSSATPHLAEMKVSGAASLGGSAGILSGYVSLSGDAAIVFGSGQITTIAKNSSLTLSGSETYIADASANTSNSALKGLTTVVGDLYLTDQQIETTAGLTNAGLIEIDTDGREGGSSLTVGGSLSSSGSVYLGEAYMTADDTISATSLTNTGDFYLTGDDAVGKQHSADVIISGAASLGSKAGQLNGSVNLSDDALVEFGSGQIATIASGASLRMTGPDVYVADKGKLTSNSALTGLSANAGTLSMDDGVQITTTGALSNSGTIYLDEYDTAAGSDLTIGGALTNSGSLSIGYYDGAIDDDDIVSAKSVNDTGGSITLNGNTSSATPHLAELKVSGAASLGASAGILSGYVSLSGDAAIVFGSGQITTIAKNSSLTLSGSETYIADASADTSNSALKGLTTVVGDLYLTDQQIKTTAGLTNAGLIQIDTDGREGGSSLTIGGALSSSGNIYLGEAYMAADDTISATSLTNTGNIYLTGDDAVGVAHSAALIISGAASLGSKAGQLNGDVSLSDDVLVEFGSGQIATIASGASLTMTGPDVYVADKGKLTSNSALTGLSANAGTLSISDGVQITTTGALSNSGTIYLDEYDTAAGSSLTIGGKLTNSGSLSIGYYYGVISDDDIVTAKSVDDTGGYITLNGNSGSATPHLAELKVSGAASLGASAGILSGDVSLSGDAAIVFKSGQITTIGKGSYLTLDGPETYVADASAQTSNSALEGLSYVEGSLTVSDDKIAATGSLTNTGQITIDSSGGGSIVTLGGALVNKGTLDIGSTQLSAATTISAASLNDTGGVIDLSGYYNITTPFLGEIKVNGAASLGATTGEVAGDIDLSGDAAIVFASGSLTTIDSSSEITLTGAHAFLADRGKTGSNSALTGLATIAGSLDLEAGASLKTTGALTNNGDLYLDQIYGNGGSMLSIDGAFSNSGTADVGNSDLSAPTTLSATTLDNTGGTIDLQGSLTSTATFSIAGAAVNTGTIDVGAGSVMKVTGALTGSGEVDLSEGGKLYLGAAGAVDVISFGAGGGSVYLTAGDQLDDVLLGFSTDDSLHLSKVTYASTDKVVYDANSTDTAGTVLLETNLGAEVAQFDVSGSYTAANFKLGHDSSSDIVVTYKS